MRAMRHFRLPFVSSMQPFSAFSKLTVMRSLPFATMASSSLAVFASMTGIFLSLVMVSSFAR